VELEQVLRHALQFFIVQHERDQLLREKINTLHRLMFTDRLLSMSMFSAGLNHHLRNSLVAISTFLELAPVKMAEEKISPDTLRDPDYWREFHAMAKEQIQRITEMLDSLGLAASGPGIEEPQEVDVAALLRVALEVARPEWEQKHILVDVHCPAALPKVFGHLQKIRQVFDLLLRDEILTLTEGKHMVWTLQSDTSSKGVEVILEDDGPGLKADDMRFLFDPFFSRSNHPQELGVNLMACFFLVHHEGGRIEVDKASLGGTRFRIYLPGLPNGTTRNGQLSSPDQWSLYEELYEKLISGRAEG
jgi:two-component system probable response regulator PhcQ